MSLSFINSSKGVFAGSTESHITGKSSGLEVHSFDSQEIGRAYNICDANTVSFEIIESFWEDFSVVQRLYTFYHEAGHARYKYRHPCESNECTSSPEDFPVMWLSVLPANTPLEEFIKDKDNFFKQRWEGIRYFNCSS